MPPASIADDIEALTFDVFGTVVNWFEPVSKFVKQKAQADSLALSDEVLNPPCYDAKVIHHHSTSLTDAADFAREWRGGYMQTVAAVAQGEPGTLDVDTMHREILDRMLTSPRWKHLGDKWVSEEERREINLVWHKLQPWPDTIKGMQRLRTKYILSSLSNANVRLHVDLAKHSHLPFDLLLPSSLFNSYKPNPLVYTSALTHLALGTTPHKGLMVAAHIYDLRAAAGVGMRTAYVRRVTEDTGEIREGVKVKSNGEDGGVDFVVDSFEELADLLGCE